MSWTIHKTELEGLVHKIEPTARLTTKDHWFWKVLAVLVCIFTFGSIPRKKFLTQYGTTIGPIIASPKEWPSLKQGYLVHEATHAADMRKAGLGIHPWAGIFFYALAYLFLFLPFGLAWFRYKLELRADIARWRYELKTGLRTPREVIIHAAARGKSLSNGTYGYAWLWSTDGYRKTVEKIIKEES